MDPLFAYQQSLTRRQFFGDAGLRVGSFALAVLAAKEGAAAARARAQADGRAGSPALAGAAAPSAAGASADLAAH